MKQWFVRFVACTFIALFQFGCTVQKDAVDILFIGNSYTYRNSMPMLFQQIAESKGEQVHVRHVTRGKYTFYLQSKRKAIKKALKYHQWDVIVLQGSSRDMLRDSVRMRKKTFPAIEQLLLDFKTTQPHARVYFYMTWPYKNGYSSDRSFNSDKKMLQGIQDGYLNLKAKYNIPVIPVGSVWYHYKKSFPNNDLYVRDKSHPSFIGSYLVACVMYQSIFNKSPMGAEKYWLYDRQVSKNIQVFVQKQFYKPEIRAWLQTQN
jgi:hypothetical protein